MMLILHFESYPPDSVNCIRYESGSAQNDGQALLADIPKLLAETPCDDVRFVIPGEQVSSFATTIPKGTRTRIRQALPFIVEDQLAANVENMHLVHSDFSTENQCLVLAIDRQVLQTYLAIADELGLPLTAIFPDYLGLQPTTDPEVAHIGGKSVIRYQDGTALSICDDLNAGTFPLEGAGRITKDQLENNWAELSPQSSLNLMGEQFRRGVSARASLLKASAIGVAAAVVIAISYFLGAGWYFHHQAEKTMNDATGLYQSLFPGDKKILDIRRQMQGHLAEATNASGDPVFFSLLNGLSTSLAKMPDSHPTPRHLQFDHQSRALVTDIQATSMGESTELRQLLEENKLAAEVLSVTKNDAGILTRLKLTLP